MAENLLKPPPTLDSCRVLEYAVLNPSIGYRGSNMYAGKELREVGPVPRLAICAWGHELLLLHCDNDWNSLGAAGYKTIEAAKAAAQRAYPGVEKLWVDAGYTVEDAEKDLQDAFAGELCCFCGKRPDELEQGRMIRRNDVRICEACIRSAMELLNEDKG